MMPTPSDQYYPQDYPADFGNIAPPVDTGVSAGIAQTPYEYQLPDNPFAGPSGLTGPLTPEEQMMAQSRYEANFGQQPGQDIPTAPGVEPDVLPAMPETGGMITTGQPGMLDAEGNVIPGTALTPADEARLANQQVPVPPPSGWNQPTNYANIPKMLGNLGRFFGGIPAALANLIRQPGYSSPAYLRSIGYQPGQGTGSLWPGGPGRFGDVVTAGDVSGGGQSPGDFQSVVGGPNVIPMTGGVGGAGGSFFTRSGHGSAGGGGGGPVQAGTYTSPAAMAELRRWMQGRYTPPGALKYPSPILVSAASGIRGFGPVFMPSAQQQQALAQQWGNVFRSRGYVLPPGAGGRGGPVPPRPGGRGTPPPLPR
jgi:hypothetical protein